MVARWHHQINGNGGSVLSLYLNGKIGDPDSVNSWTLESGDHLSFCGGQTLPPQAATWIDAARSPRDGKTFSRGESSTDCLSRAYIVRTNSVRYESQVLNGRSRAWPDRSDRKAGPTGQFSDRIAPPRVLSLPVRPERYCLWGLASR